ncbi:MAG TPA: DUF4019 domain-containing protein [Longimicrobiales bacterium]|jgi:hypothetical protein
MHRLAAVVIIATIILAGAARPGHAQGTQPTADTAAAVQAAQTAGEAWLALIVEGKGKESWAATSKHFQAAVTENAWAQQAAELRSQLGRFQSRKLADAHYTIDPPNAPAGEYVLLLYESTFANLPTAHELVSLTREDGRWKVIGYFVQPAER